MKERGPRYQQQQLTFIERAYMLIILMATQGGFDNNSESLETCLVPSS